MRAYKATLRQWCGGTCRDARAHEDAHRWARRLAFALPVVVAVLDATRKNWFSAAQVALMAYIIALLRAVVARHPTKVRQNLSLVVLVTAHAVPNLYVTDGACMTGSACQNPSITYMALTARAVAHAVEQLNQRAT